MRRRWRHRSVGLGRAFGGKRDEVPSEPMAMLEGELTAAPEEGGGDDADFTFANAV